MAFYSLPEEDYLAIFSFIEQLGLCLNRRDLRGLLETQLLALLASNSCFYCFADPDLKQITVLDAVNIPPSIFPSIAALSAYDHLGPNIVGKMRPVMAYDVDFDRRLFREDIERFYRKYPEHGAAFKPYGDRFNSSIATLSLPDVSVGVGVHRLDQNVEKFTLREIRILELLGPSLMQNIRSLVLTEELNRYRSFAESLAKVESPIALASADWKLIFRNEAFGRLLPEKKYLRLPGELIDFLERELKRNASVLDRCNKFEVPVYRIAKRTYRPTLTAITTGKEKLWMLRFERVVDEYSKLLRILNELELTQREIEIAIYVRSGMSYNDIAKRLCISYNTVRNHITKIFSKTNMSSLSQLVAWLNR